MIKVEALGYIWIFCWHFLSSIIIIGWPWGWVPWREEGLTGWVTWAWDVADEKELEESEVEIDISWCAGELGDWVLGGVGMEVVGGQSGVSLGVSIGWHVCDLFMVESGHAGSDLGLRNKNWFSIKTTSRVVYNLRVVGSRYQYALCSIEYPTNMQVETVVIVYEQYMTEDTSSIV